MSVPTTISTVDWPTPIDMPRMTLRDYFAAQALAALAPHYPIDKGGLAQYCYLLADAMLKARGMT